MTPSPPQAKVVANNDKNRTFSVSYVPKVTGVHKVGQGGTFVGTWGAWEAFWGGPEAFWGHSGAGWGPAVLLFFFFFSSEV